MPYPIYANREDIVNYLGLKDDTTLPEDIERQIKRASELIYCMTYGNIKTFNERHLEAARIATCAQVEYWLKIGEDTDITGQTLTNFSLDDLSMNFGNSSNKSVLAPRARQYLNAEGLLYRGIGW